MTTETTKNAKKFGWTRNVWQVKNFPNIKGEYMEMYLKEIPANSIGVAQFYTCDTLYYVMQGQIIFLSGDDLERREIQKEGTFFHLPSHLLHTMANVNIERVSIIVTHDITNISNATKTFPSYDSKLKEILSQLKSERSTTITPTSIGSWPKI